MHAGSDALEMLCPAPPPAAAARWCDRGGGEAASYF
jgi:hypothetical protein